MTKTTQPNKKEGDFSLFSNLNLNVDKNTQTASKKKLIKGILHGVGFGGSIIGDPISTLDTNINLHVARMKKQGVNPEIISTLQSEKSYARNNNRG